MQVTSIDIIDPHKMYCPDITVKITGNITEIRSMMHPMEPSIQKISKSAYVYLATGEYHEYEQKESISRLDNKYNIVKSITRLRDLINTNVTDSSRCLWVTLTYAENMRSTERLYEDFRRFIQRLQYKMECGFQYICACEPQARGAWHVHLILIFPYGERPFIHNETMSQIWGHGFTMTKAVYNIDNLGAYLSAYLGDMDVAECDNVKSINPRSIREVEAMDAEGNKIKKSVVKGGRLHLYPAGFHMLRHSRDLREPLIIKVDDYEDALQYVSGSPKVFENTKLLRDDNNHIINTITYQQFNKLRK